MLPPQSPSGLRSTSLFLAALATSAAAQQPQGASPEAGLKVATLRAEPSRLVIERGRMAPLMVTAFDAQGQPVDAMLRYAAPFRSVRVRNGQVLGIVPGDYEIVATVVVPPGATKPPATLTIPVSVRWPGITHIIVTSAPAAFTPAPPSA